MPLHLAEHVARVGPPKERLEIWIRDKIVAGGTVPDYYPPSAGQTGRVRARNRRTVRALTGWTFAFV